MLGIRPRGLALALLVLVGAGAPAQSPGRLRYSARLEDLEVLRQRLELETGSWRLLALDARRGLKPIYQTVGLEAPWLLLGPVEPRGLLRELANPLGFLPGSSAFTEASGLRLEGSLDGASRRGLQLEPLPDRLELYAARSRSLPLAFGGILQTSLGRAGQAEALAQVALPEKSAAAEEWFAAELPYPGGPLLHLAGRIRLGCPPNQPEPAGPFLAWSAALCAGPRVAPGLYSRLGAGLEARQAAGEALLGVCDTNYRTPEGGVGPQGTQLACRLRVGPPTGTHLQADWNRQIGRPASGPARASSVCLPSSERWSLRLWLEARRSRTKRLGLEAAGELGAEWGTDGVPQRNARGALELRIESGRRKQTLGACAAWQEHGGWNHIRGYASHRCGALLLEGGLEMDPASPREGELLAAIELTGRRQSLSLRVRAALQRQAELTLAWSTAQELPKSPTGRISRSSSKP
jgi:hypothetical protein